MAADAVPGVARLEEALNRIGHQQPKFSIHADIFNKHGNAKTYNHDDSLIQQAKATGWVPLYESSDPNAIEETWATHLALQDFGVGAGHVLYYEMIREFAPRTHDRLSKEHLVREFGLGVHTSNLANIHHKDLLSMAIMKHITRHFFDNHGEFPMLTKESRERRAIQTEIKEKIEEETRRREEREASYREDRVPPKRPHPAEQNAERAKARRVARGHGGVAAERGNTFQGPIPSPESPGPRVFNRPASITSSSSPQNPFATPNSAFGTPRVEAAAAAPSSMSGTPRAAVTFQRLPYARDNVRNQDEEDETLDAFDEFNLS